jgi:pimeloyl-ACP methyl ester carboxylesterase
MHTTVKGWIEQHLESGASPAAVPAWSSLGHINYLPDLGLAAWGLMTWAFVLEDIGHDSTRLIVRARGGPGYRFHELPWWAAKHIVTMIHFVMQRKQLLGIARRAEVIMSRPLAFKTPEGEAAFLAAYDAAMKLWPVPYEERDIPTRFGMTHVIVSGPRNAPPLVLLHGYMGTSTMWAPNIADLSKDHRVYAIDVMGQPGKSIPDEPIRNDADYVGWLTATLTWLHLSRISLVGMSFGGWIALNYAAAEPERVRKLVLLSPGGLLPINKGFSLRGMLMVFFPTRFTVDSFMRWAGFSTASGETDARPILNLMYLGMKHFRMPKDTLRIAADPLSDYDLHEMHVPTLVLFGENEVLCDPTEALARARRLIPDFQGELLPSSSHDMCVSQRAIVDTRIREFLSDTRHNVPERRVA